MLEIRCLLLHMIEGLEYLRRPISTLRIHGAASLHYPGFAVLNYVYEHSEAQILPHKHLLAARTPVV